MSNNNNHDEDDAFDRGHQGGSLSPQTWLQWIAVAAIAAAMGLGGAAVLPQIAPSNARPDPFTGTMGREMRSELMADIDRIDTEGSRMVQALHARVAALEARNAELVNRLQRIEELLIELRVRMGAPRRPGDDGRM